VKQFFKNLGRNAAATLGIVAVAMAIGYVFLYGFQMGF
jgi:hypothetical protein